MLAFSPFGHAPQKAQVRTLFVVRWRIEKTCRERQSRNGGGVSHVQVQCIYSLLLMYSYGLRQDPGSTCRLECPYRRNKSSNQF